MTDIVQHDFTILANFITLPQLVIHWFVGCMMPEHTISIVPNGGYDSSKYGSLKERMWLSYMDKMNKRLEGNQFVPITSRYCSGHDQHGVGAFYLDGYRELPNGHRECFEFYGCYYHGCTMCFPDRSKVVRCKHRENGYVMVEKAYVDTMDREQGIKCEMRFDNTNDKWIIIWEHGYNDMEDLIKKELGEQCVSGLVEKMNPRNAAKGGRTKVFRMHALVKNPDKQSIRYLDVNSLYPYVMSITEFPVGHPTIRRGDYSCRSLLRELDGWGVSFIGMCLVRVLAPRNLIVPYLLTRLMESLCSFYAGNVH